MIHEYIIQIRSYKQDHTESELIVPWVGGRFCYILEDVARPTNVKIPGETCIPEGIYQVGYSMSTRFGKEMLTLTDEIGGYQITKSGVNFKGVRVHGGNDVDDTHGCPLANYTNTHDGTMYGRASDDLLAIIKTNMAKGIVYQWIITSR